VEVRGFLSFAVICQGFLGERFVIILEEKHLSWSFTRQYRNILIETDDSINMEAVQKMIDYINIMEIDPKN